MLFDLENVDFKKIRLRLSLASPLCYPFSHLFFLSDMKSLSIKHFWKKFETTLKKTFSCV